MENRGVFSRGQLGLIIPAHTTNHTQAARRAFPGHAESELCLLISKHTGLFNIHHTLEPTAHCNLYCVHFIRLLFISSSITTTGKSVYFHINNNTFYLKVHQGFASNRYNLSNCRKSYCDDIHHNVIVYIICIQYIDNDFPVNHIRVCARAIPIQDINIQYTILIINTNPDSFWIH